MSSRAQEELQRDLLTHRSAVAALANHPSWAELIEEISEKREKIEARLLRRAKDMGDPLSEREAGYMVGYLDGLSYLARIPKRVETELNRQNAKEAKA